MATFTRSGDSPFWALDPAPGACTVAHLPFDPHDAGTSMSLTDSWQRYPGTYLVAPANTPLDDTLAATLTAFRAGRPLRLVWVANPQQPAARWRASWLASDGTVVTDLSRLGLASLDLWIGAGCAITPTANDDALTVSPRPDDPDSIRLTSGFGASTLVADTAVTLPFDSHWAGCAQTGFTLRNTGGTGDLAALDVGLRIFTADQDIPTLPDRLTSWRYPVFTAVQSGPAAYLPVTLSAHPLLPLDPSRTCLELVPSDQTVGPELASCYVTTNGLAVHLTPLAPAGAPARAGKLVLAIRALSDGPSDTDPVYFVPSGAFRITVVDAEGHPVDGDQRLLCGISGIECVLVQPGCELWFSPGGAALAAGKGLRTTATTAYASVFGPDGTAGRIYRAQAHDAALFEPAALDGFLSFRELSGITLPAAGAGGELPAGYPLLPYTGITATDAESYRRLEFQPVASARRALIGTLGITIPRRMATAEVTTATVTPQGLLADVDANGTVVNLTLARSASGEVQLGGVSADLAAALQSNQLFLVASDPATLCATQPADGKIGIPGPSDDPGAGWTINAWPAEPWTDTGTLLVLKFAGTPLSRLAADTDSWAGNHGTQFNPGPNGVTDAQSVLLGLVELATTSSDTEFAAFAELAEDPTWQGVLFLNAPVPPAQLPNQIAGLAAGIDAASFKAHHLGLTVTPTTVSGGVITAHHSSLFGLIAYRSTMSAAGAAPPYSFNVRNLEVRFENSAVRTFTSRIELLVDELFGEGADLVDPATLAPLPTNVLVLDGVYQQQGGSGGYTFSAPGDNLFELDSAVLDTVEVTAARFVTVVPPDLGSPTTPAQSRFSLTAALRFKPAELDVFSFGPTTVHHPADRLSAQRLYCSNLWITLDYVPADPSKNAYTFDATHLVPDPVQSVARDTSLFAGFPLTLAGFVHVPKQQPGGKGIPATPTSLGFLGIGTTPPLGGGITAPWFGIVADLGFGTAGALAAEAGFKASMLMSWSPGNAARSANAGIGLKLPGGGSGGKLLSLQSVLKLKVGELALSNHDGTYLLQLDRIALSVLMLTFPSAGQLDALLFADPTGKDHTTLGWYAGYAKTGGS